MHFCADELMAITASLPFIGVGLRRLHAWWHRLRCPHETTLQRAQRLLGRGETIQVSEAEFDALQTAFDAKVEPNEALKKAFQGFCTDHGIRYRDCPVCSSVVAHVTRGLVPLQPGEVNLALTPVVPDGFRPESDDEFRERISKGKPNENLRKLMAGDFKDLPEMPE